MNLCFHVVLPYHLNVTEEIEAHQTRQHLSNLLLYSFGDPLRSFFFLVTSHSSLIHGLNKAFLPKERLLSRYFHIFGPFSVNPGDGAIPV